MKNKFQTLLVLILIGFSGYCQDSSNLIIIDSTKIKIFRNTVYRVHQGTNKGSGWKNSIKYTEILLLDVIFKKSQSKILSKSFDELNKLSTLLNDNPIINIQIDGHTDKVGNRKKNLKLSKRRAKAIKKYLKKRNIKSKRIVIHGFGDQYPICESPCDKNRRVEFKFI